MLSESTTHILLKKIADHFLTQRAFHKFGWIPEHRESKATTAKILQEYRVKVGSNSYVVDLALVDSDGENIIAIECGTVGEPKIQALKKVFKEVYNITVDDILKQYLFFLDKSSTVFKNMKIVKGSLRKFIRLVRSKEEKLDELLDTFVDYSNNHFMGKIANARR